MPRRPRIAPGGYVFHVLNRGNGRRTIFEDAADYAAFERILAECIEPTGMRLAAYCLMPNHWHLILWPREDGDLARFMHRLTTMHVRRWHQHRPGVGGGHLYQGTYKSFPVQEDDHYLAVCRYVERNALRAKLARRAESWRWCSLWRRMHAQVIEDVPPLTPWPVAAPARWVERVNRPQTGKELEALRRSVHRGQPFGSETWIRRVAKALALESTLRPRGRPRKETPK